MAVVDVHRFAESITCHAWSPDLSSKFFLPLAPFCEDEKKRIQFFL